MAGVKDIQLRQPVIARGVQAESNQPLCPLQYCRTKNPSCYSSEASLQMELTMTLPHGLVSSRCVLYYSELI